jgi:hypothetical protein
MTSALRTGEGLVTRASSLHAGFVPSVAKATKIAVQKNLATAEPPKTGPLFAQQLGVRKRGMI